MPKSSITRLLLQVGRALIVRPIRTGAVFLTTLGVCMAVCFLTEWSDRASVTLTVRTLGATSAPGEAAADDDRSVFSTVYLDLLRSDTVLSRTLLAVGYPDSPAAAEYRKWRHEWEGTHSPKAWAALSKALSQLDAEAERLRRDEVAGRTMLTNLAGLSKRVEVRSCGSQGSAEVVKMSVSWPVRCGDVRLVADCLSQMACDRLMEAQMRAAQEASDFIRLRRESLRPDQLVPAEDAIRRFVEEELASPADLAQLEQLSRSSEAADLPSFIKRMRQELLSLDSQRAEARNLRRLLLEALPASLWNGGRRRGDDGELIGPDMSRVDEKHLPDHDPILADVTQVVPREALDRNVVLSRLKIREAELLQELNRLRSEFNPAYMGIADKRAELARTRRQILTQVIGEAAQLEVSIAGMVARQTELQQRIEAAERQLQRLMTKLGRYQQLTQELDASRKRYFQAWLDETQAMQDQWGRLPTAVLHVLDISVDYAGRRALLASPWKAALTGCVVGFGLALAYAVTADLLDRTLRWPDEVERHVKLSVVGRIRKAGNRIVA
ncbi:MAG: hypothetical protein ACUVXJ_14535 [Phycisphaerae bacterium]